MSQILLCCVLALLLAALGLLLRSLRRRSRPSGGNETLKALLVCFFTCGILLHLPMYAAAYAGEHLSWLKALLGAVHHTLRMFVLDGELDPIHEFAMSRPAVWSDLYFGAAIVVYLVSPLLTFSVVLSFFKNLSALWRYAFRRCTELYVFPSSTRTPCIWRAASRRPIPRDSLSLRTSMKTRARSSGSRWPPPTGWGPPASRQTSPCCGCGALTAPARSTSSCWAGTRQRTSIRRCC